MKDKFQKATALALTLSIAAIALSAYATVRVSKGGGVNAADFDKRVEQGIQAFIQKQQGQQAQGQRTAEKVDNAIATGPTLGSASAPITLVEFSDFQCPYCGRFFSQTFPQLKSNYFDTGKVQLFFRDFPLSFHENARPAAIAAKCILEQSNDKMYFAFHDKIFTNQPALSLDNLPKWAAEVGANAAKFKACFDGKKTDAAVTADFDAGQTAGVTGTPGFFLLMDKKESKVADLKAQELVQQGQYIIQYVETQDGKKMGLRISGAHPYSTFEKAFKVGL